MTPTEGGRCGFPGEEAMIPIDGRHPRPGSLGGAPVKCRCGLEVRVTELRTARQTRKGFGIEVAAPLGAISWCPRCGLGFDPRPGPPRGVVGP